MTVARRSFLRLLAAAPVAAPVVARDAAAKAGIGAVGLGIDNYGPPVSGQCYPAEPASEREWIAGNIKRVLSKAWEQEQRDSMRHWYPSRLDPDLAASRSLSLSAALRLQRERDVESNIDRERADAKRHYLRVFGLEFIA